ncbi:MAG: hypothetical protein ACI9TF_000220 [Paracrocinitomix sp.]|jgi:hypothetical protein
MSARLDPNRPGSAVVSPKVKVRLLAAQCLHMVPVDALLFVVTPFAGS